MKITKIDNIEIKAGAKVRVKEMGNIIEVMWSDSYHSKCSIKKLDKDRYVTLGDGEIKEFNHIENRSHDMKSVSKTLGRLRDYLNTNITDVNNCRWVTLTYAENMTDTVRLLKDFEKFNKKLKYHIKMPYEYIVAMEPQGRGAWHAHLVLIFDSKAPYIENKWLRDIWGHGFVKIKAIDSVDNVGAYLTAYMTDMEVEEIVKAEKLHEYVGRTFEVKEVEVEELGEKKVKKFIKGARLNMYPPQFNIYRCSKGIKKPNVCYQLENEVKEKVSSGKLTYQKTLLLEDTDNDFQRTINYRYYNLKSSK